MTLTTILSILVAAAYIAANIVMVYIVIQDGSTVSDILSEQDFGLVKAGVVLIYWPALFFIYLRSLRHIDTSFSFGEDEEVKSSEF